MNDKKPTIEEAIRHVDAMQAVWLPVLSKFPTQAARRLETKDARGVLKDINVIFQNCQTCTWLRDTWNNGEYGEGDWCLNRCPGTYSCNIVLLKTRSTYLALHRVIEGREMLDIDGGCHECPELERCLDTDPEDRFALCVSSMAAAQKETFDHAEEHTVHLKGKLRELIEGP